MTQVVILTKSDYNKVLKELENARRETVNEEACSNIAIALQILRRKG